MRTHMRRTVCAGVLAGGFTVLGLALAASPASADDSNGAGGLVSGNQSSLQVHLPVALGGQQVTIGGNGNSHHSKGGSGGSASGGSGSTSGGGGTGSGNQTGTGAHVPVSVSGNQVSVLGNHNTEQAQTPGSGHMANPAGTPFQGTSGRAGTGSGNQTSLQVGAPVSLCGNQVTVIGDGNDAAGCSTAPAGGTDATGTSDGTGTTSGQDGTAAGNQSWLGLIVPVDATGNQATVIGDGNQSSQSPTSSTSDDAGSSAATPETTAGDRGTGSGNQTGLEGAAPVDASGNQVTVIGDGNTRTGETTVAPSTGGDTTDPTTTDPTTGGDTTGGDTTGTPGTGTTGANGVGSGTGSGSGNSADNNSANDNSANDGSQGGATVAQGALPSELADTGAAAGLQQWLLLGLILMAGGLILCTRRFTELALALRGRR